MRCLSIIWLLHCMYMYLILKPLGVYYYLIKYYYTNTLYSHS